MPEDLLTKALAAFPESPAPHRLLRFYGGDAIGALKNGTIRFAPPKEFNDPFEMSPGLSSADITLEEMLESVLPKDSLFRNMWQVHGTGLKDDASYEARVKRVMRERPDLWRDHLRSYRDSVSGTATDLLGISCFSEFTEAEFVGELGLRHWAIYGDKHTGFALEYDGTHPFFTTWAKAKWLFKVKYIPARITVSLRDFAGWSDLKMWTTYRAWAEMKSSLAWGDEHEWRLLCPISATTNRGMTISHVRAGASTYHFFHLWAPGGSKRELAAGGRAITRVVLGAKSKQSLRDEVAACLSQPHLKHVQLFHATACDERFALNLKKI